MRGSKLLREGFEADTVSPCFPGAVTFGIACYDRGPRHASTASFCGVLCLKDPTRSRGLY